MKNIPIKVNEEKRKKALLRKIKAEMRLIVKTQDDLIAFKLSHPDVKLPDWIEDSIADPITLDTIKECKKNIKTSL